MGVKLLGVLAIVIAALLAVAALLGFLVSPWVTIGMSLFVLALLALHKRRTAQIRKGDLVFRVRHRATYGDD